MRIARWAALLLLAGVFVGAEDGKGSGWVELFDGKTLNGWKRVNGTARFEVEDGVIVGTTVPGSPNSFLATEKEYKDFELEVEFKVDEGLNSGVQIRSRSEPGFKNGRVYGYQVEIDPAVNGKYSSTTRPNYKEDGTAVPVGAGPRAWTGGIQEEGRRGWLADLTKNPKAREAFKPGEWNKFRIEAKGDVMKTWLNGVAAAEVTDKEIPSGFIALQVHSTKSETPLRVWFRGIRVRELSGEK